MADPHLSKVTVLVNGRGPAGSLGLANLAFAGGSASSDATTPPVASTAQAKYGGASVRFAGNGYLRVPHSAGNTVTTGDWTFEGWFYFLSVASSAVLVTKSVGTGIYPFQLAYIADSTPGIGLRLFNAASTLVECRSAYVPPLNTWVHIAATRSGDSFTVWVNGVAVATAALNGALLSSSADLIVGAYSSNQFGLDGYGDDIRLTVGVARYTAPFTPPAEVETPPPPELKMLRMPGRLVGEPLPPVSYRMLRMEPALRDMHYSGRGVIVGTVTAKGTPNQPLRRRLRLFRERDGHFVRETWSDSITGGYAFPWIDETRQYTVITYDHTNDEKRAVVADNITPDLMP